MPQNVLQLEIFSFEPQDSCYFSSKFLPILNIALLHIMFEALSYRVRRFSLIFTSKIYDLSKLCWEYIYGVQVDV